MRPLRLKNILSPRKDHLQFSLSLVLILPSNLLPVPGKGTRAGPGAAPQRRRWSGRGRHRSRARCCRWLRRHGHCCSLRPRGGRARGWRARRRSVFFFCSWSCRLFKASVERVREGFQGGVESDPRRGKKKEVILRLAFWFLLLFSLRRTKKIRRHRSTFAHFACLSFHSLALSLLRFLCPSRI